MSFSCWDYGISVSSAVDKMDEKHLRWLVKVLLRPPKAQEMDKPIESLEGFLRQTETDYLFQEAVVKAKKTLDAAYMPYNAYYKDRLVKLVLDISYDAGVPEEGVIFQSLAQDLEVSFLKFWDGTSLSRDLDRKKEKLLAALTKIVQRAIKVLGLDYFLQSQQDILSSILGVKDLTQI